MCVYVHIIIDDLKTEIRAVSLYHVQVFNRDGEALEQTGQLLGFLLP